MGILLLSVGYAGTVAQHSMYSPHLHKETQHCMLLIDQVVHNVWASPGGGLGGWSPTSHSGVLRSVPGHKKMVLLLTKWHMNRSFSEYLDFSLQIFSQCSIHFRSCITDVIKS